MLSATILSSFSRKPHAPDYAGGTINTELATALDFLTFTVPGFLEIIKDKKVLDFGCGWGWQAVSMAQRGAKSVVGIDIQDLSGARERAQHYGCADKVRFVSQLEPDMLGSFDLIVSCSSFEHFADPEASLRLMISAARIGGQVIVSFAEPWYSPHGSHMNFFTKVPWVNLLFSEDAVMEVRSQFRKDGARRYEDVEGGLNRMTLAKFENIISSSGMHVEFLEYYSVKGLPLVKHIPMIRELLVASAACILRKPH
jgi:ubiquinone/menaquinone biosynthesis C-methylase UbiE